MSDRSENEILEVAHEFLLRYGSHRETNSVRSMEEYRALYPGFEDIIEREYAAITNRGDDEDRSAPTLGIERIGPYRIVRELGHGGQGVVYLAEDTRLGRPVALKVLTSHAKLGSGTMARFRQEAEITSRLDHPGICTVYESGSIDGFSFIAMQFVDGDSLAGRIDQSRMDGDTCVRLPDREGGPAEPEMRIVALLEGIARAVHAAHEHGVIHRDIKPSNIMVGRDGRGIVMDFGLAREQEGDALTHTGDVLGTPAYLPPERVRGEAAPADARTDVYALGASLYECLALRRPFEAPTRDALYRRILTTDVSRITSGGTPLARDLQLVIETALEKDPNRRYRNALALAEDLQRVRNRQRIHARPIPLSLRARRWLQRNPGVAVSVICLFFVLAIGLVVSLVQYRNATITALVARSASILSRDPERALALAAEAFRLRQDHDTVSQLYSALAAPFATQTLRPVPAGPGASLSAAIPSPEGTHLLLLAGSRLTLRNTLDGSPTPIELPQVDGRLAIRCAAFAPRGDRFAVACDELRDDDEIVQGHLVVATLDGRISHSMILAGEGFWPRQGQHLWTGNLVFAADGTLVSATARGTVRLHRQDGAVEASLAAHDAAIRHLALAPQGRRFVTASADGSARVFQITDDSKIVAVSELRSHLDQGQGVLWAAFSPDGQRVVTASSSQRSGIAELWTADGRRLGAMPHRWIKAATFSPSGEFILTTGGKDHAAKLWTSEGEFVAWLPARAGVRMAVFSTDGRRIILGCQDGTARLFEITRSPEVGTREVTTLRGHKAAVPWASFLQDSNRVVTASWDGTAKIWSIDPPGFEVFRGQHAPWSAAVAPDGAIASVSVTGQTTLWIRSAGGAPRRTELPELRGPGRVHFSPDGNRILTVGEKGTVHLHDRRSGSDNSQTLSSDLFQASFSPLDGSIFVTGRGMLAKLEPASRTFSSLAKIAGKFYGLAVAPNSREVAAGLIDGSIHAFGLPGGERRIRTHGSKAVMTLDYCPNAPLLASAGIERHICLHRLDREAAPQRFEAHSSQIHTVRFSPDGELLLSASNDGTARIWDRTGLPIATLQHDGMVRSAVWSRDGDEIVTACADGTVRVWPAPRRLAGLLALRLGAGRTIRESR